MGLGPGLHLAYNMNKSTVRALLCFHLNKFYAGSPAREQTKCKLCLDSGRSQF